mgnify:CR=1 FL=1
MSCLTVGIIQIEIGIAIEIEILCHSVREESSAYGVDSDPDSDFDPEEGNPNNMKCVAQILETNLVTIQRVVLKKRRINHVEVQSRVVREV